MTAIQPHNPPNRRCLKLTGEIDLANAADYLGTARKMIAERRTDASFIIDLSNVTFMDSTALGMLVNFRRGAPNAGKELRLAGTPWCISRLLEITGLDDHFRIDEPLISKPARWRGLNTAGSLRITGARQTPEVVCRDRPREFNSSIV